MLKFINFLMGKFRQEDKRVSEAPRGVAGAPMRLLIVANAIIPTVQLCLLKPMKEVIDSGECAVSFLTEQQIAKKFKVGIRSAESWDWTKKYLDDAAPTFVIFCRYSGPHAESMLAYCKANALPTLYCIDDDILNVPEVLGEKKYNYHNDPLRLNAVRHLLDSVDLVYCSNIRLRERLVELGVNKDRVYAGDIFCSGEPMVEVELRSVKVIGYMGFDHAHDFEIALPGLINVLRKYPDTQFELFGKIPKPPSLEEFGGRIVVLPSIPDYEEFLDALALRKWDIGICPLASTDFNQVKNINKWIEYSAVGTAVVATADMIYDECCSDGCGLLTDQAGWEAALTQLIDNPQLRMSLVSKAQASLSENYSVGRLMLQLRSVFNQTIKISGVEA
ncbi:glycosyltransferase [Pseudomonas sp. GM50]|uniref:glycosyltransferase family 1 protein n=1 Tax=Pseudomonas sp. GM50 TaxID=1144332 RepID=UPI00027090AF|nr:glycosyltransferase family 1 protein [Pseudomonas sp. GM50]EJM65085.1 glycosyltransferase [Pseudomonas sp. GM50]